MDDLTTIDLNWLRALAYLLETGSVSLAARRAGVGQPAMSRTLAHLRRVLGDPLLVQHGRGSRLTEHAESLKPQVQDALLAVQAALRAPAKFEPHKEQFQLRIAANDYMHSALLAPWLSSARKLAPGLELSLESVGDHSISQLASGELDFVMGPPVHKPGLGLERFVARALWSDHYLCAMRRQHPLSRGRLDMERLSSAELVRVMCGNFTAACDAALTQHAAYLRPRVVVRSFLQAAQLLRQSDAIALMPARLLAIDSSLVGRKLPFEAGVFRIYLAWHPRLTASPRHRWFRQNILEYAAQQNKARPAA